MHIRLSLGLPLAVALIAIAGAIFLPGGGESAITDVRAQFGAIPAGDDDDDYDPCIEGIDALFNLGMAMVFGTEHQQFIALDEFMDLVLDCLFGTAAAAPAGAGSVPVRVTSTGTNFVDVEGLWDPSTRSLTADGIGTVAGFQDVTVELELQVSETGEVTGTYTMGAAGELPGGNAGVYEITGQVDLPTPTPVVTETPAPTATATSQATPTATGRTGQLLTMGNIDCDEDGISTRDNQALLRNVLTQAALSQTEPCPDIGDVNSVTVPSTLGQQLAWGDMDCDGGISTRDNQALLRNVLTQAALSQTEPCPDIGTEVLITTGS